MSIQQSSFCQHVDPDEIIHIVSTLVQLNTVNPPGNEYLCLPFVTEKMRELGMEVSVYEKEKGRSNIVGKIGDGSPSLAIVTHMDTVPPGDLALWESDPFEPLLKDGKIYGRGSLDDKGCFSVAFEACKAFLKQYPLFGGTLYLIAAADEELGSKLGIKYLVEELGMRFDSAIIPDGGEKNFAVYGEKGIVWLKITSFGRQVHGSIPQLGKNAIVPLAQLVVDLQTLDFGKPWNPVFDGWTMNIGKFDAGDAANIVPAKASAVLDFRLPDGLTPDDVLRLIQHKIEIIKQKDQEARFTVEILHQTQPHIVDRNCRIMKSFDCASNILQIPMRYGIMGGNTVAKDLFFAGINSVVHYPGDHHLAHIPNEYVKVADIVEGAVLYAETLKAYFLPVE